MFVCASISHDALVVTFELFRDCLRLRPGSRPAPAVVPTAWGKPRDRDPGGLARVARLSVGRVTYARDGEGGIQLLSINREPAR